MVKLNIFELRCFVKGGGTLVRKRQKDNKANIKLRFNSMTVFVYIIGIVLIVQLFNLQIVHGAEYKEQSNTRLTRETTIESARGTIMDKSGNVLVTSKTKFALELYKSKIDTEALNECILNIIQVLEKYDVKYPDSLPISIEPFNFTIEGESLSKWKKAQNLDENISAEEAFATIKEKYKINRQDNVETRKIMAIRYEISQKGYSSTKSITIAQDIPREAVAEFSESGEKFPGINIVEQP